MTVEVYKPEKQFVVILEVDKGGGLIRINLLAVNRE